eukprot:5725015-Prymnesium_polylepis.1
MAAPPPRQRTGCIPEPAGVAGRRHPKGGVVRSKEGGRAYSVCPVMCVTGLRQGLRGDVSTLLVHPVLTPPPAGVGTLTGAVSTHTYAVC